MWGTRAIHQVERFGTPKPGHAPDLLADLTGLVQLPQAPTTKAAQNAAQQTFADVYLRKVPTATQGGAGPQANAEAVSCRDDHIAAVQAVALHIRPSRVERGLGVASRATMASALACFIGTALGIGGMSLPALGLAALLVGCAASFVHSGLRSRRMDRLDVAHTLKRTYERAYLAMLGQQLALARAQHAARLAETRAADAGVQQASEGKPDARWAITRFVGPCKLSLSVGTILGAGGWLYSHLVQPTLSTSLTHYPH